VGLAHCLNYLASSAFGHVAVSAQFIMLRNNKYPLGSRAAVLLAVSLLYACAAADPDSDQASTGGSSATAGARATTGGASGSAGGGSGGTISAGGGGAAGVSGSLAGGGASSGSGGSSLGGGGGLAGSTAQNGGGGGGDHGGAGGAGGGGGSGGAGGSPVTEKAPPIGKKFVGNIDTRTRIRSDFVRYWNQFTPENAGKWASIERTRNQMNWTALDEMYNYAKQRGIVFKQHNFVWGSQQPSWLNSLSQAEQRAEVEEWIKSFCERYPDVPIIDVVNEPPPHTTPVYVAALGGAGSSGYDWIAQAFKWAHQYCPNSILILNDYNNIEYSGDTAHTIDIVKKIKAAGAPIDAVGAQAHDAYKMSTSSVQSAIDRIASETGLPVYISEYDIDIADDNQQKSVMQSQFTMFYTSQNVKGITIWGYISGQTWKANTGLMSSSGTPRPALTWLLDYLAIPK